MSEGSFGQESECHDHGTFRNPWTNDQIRVEHAGCARFWIEFELGKFIAPIIRESFELLEPRIVKAAEESFEVSFAQACALY